MRRLFVLGSVLAIGALSISVSALQAPAGEGLAPAAVAAAKLEKIKDNLYIIAGSSSGDTFSGGNVAVFVTDTGVVVVDTKLPGWGQVILDRIKTVTNKPVTTVINTHTHSDHSGSNEFFGTQVESVVQENTKTNMQRMDAFKGEKAKFLPKRTFKDKLTLGKGKDQIDLYHFGRGHTDGDTFVVFTALRTMHAGDMFARKGTPFIDGNNGGSGVEFPKTLAKVIGGIKSVDTVITGHMAPATWNDLKEFAEFNQDFLTYAEGAAKAGKSAEQAASEYKIPAKYKDYTVGSRFGGPQANIQLIYDELKKK
jgi:glyoxylase-like metal-dependent hydrolase (beta-lactamase superfamily II)